jgi:hypothetical protein
LAVVTGGLAWLLSRQQRSLTHAFPEIVQALGEWFAGDVVLDGGAPPVLDGPDQPEVTRHHSIASVGTTYVWIHEAWTDTPATMLGL